MYHRVLPPQERRASYSAAAMFVTPSTFDKHMRTLNRYFSPVNLDQFLSLLESGRPFPRRTCLVTFDDGWLDNLSHALPILERHQVPAAVFVTSGNVGSPDGFWQERLTKLLAHAWRDTVIQSEIRLALGDTAELSSDVEDVTAAARRTVTSLKEKSVGQIESFIRVVQARLSALGATLPGENVDRLMTWDDVRRLSDSRLISIGSHGKSHTPLTKLPLDLVRAELADSARRLHEELGDTVPALAYPNGDHDVDARVAAKTCGYRIAFTTERGTVGPDDDPYALRRISIHEGAAPNESRFLCRMVGIC
jgi:peptidoglycan/xylan/chitin deacetylase (PgdA/CDA1 family)